MDYERKDPLVEAMGSVPHLYESLRSSAGIPAIKFPGIFNCAAQIDFVQDALRHAATDYPNTLDVIDLPHDLEAHSIEILSVCKAILEDIKDVERVFPLQGPLMDKEYKEACDILVPELHTWILGTLKQLHTPEVLDSYRLPKHIGVLLLRILLFLSRWDKEFDDDLVIRTSNTLAGICMHRYAKSVLLPIAETRKTLNANQPKELRELSRELCSFLVEWISYSKEQVINEIEELVSEKN